MARRRRSLRLDAVSVDYGTPEAARQADAPKVAECDPHEPNVTVIHRRVLSQRVVDRLLRQGMITQRQHQAAGFLYTDWRACGFERPGGGFLARLMRVQGGGNTAQASQAQAYAEMRLREALKAVGGRLSDMLVSVVLIDRPLLDAYQDRRWTNRPQRQAAAVTDLCHALDDLVRFYGV
ncbi:MAG: hypothetical protein IPI58_09805 [Alphaproteobacteria bacterium]|nr:MAG: hypothetical protein IPI58_09805 [Alphaproteobacteria bacterium]